MVVDELTCEAVFQCGAGAAGDRLALSKGRPRANAVRKRQALATARLIEPIHLRDDSSRKRHADVDKSAQH